MREHAPTYKKNGKHKAHVKAAMLVNDHNAQAEIKKIADDLSTSLRSLGFTVHRSDSRSSNSVYLCIDYGLCNTIRVSDHPRASHHRYNVLLGTAKNYTLPGVNDRFFYSPDALDDLLGDVARRLSERMGYMGYEGYIREKERLREEKEQLAGWDFTEEKEVMESNG